MNLSGVGYRILLVHELKPVPLGIVRFVCTEPETTGAMTLEMWG